MALLYIRDELNETWIPCVGELGDIPNVSISAAPTNGAALVYDTVSGKWIDGTAVATGGDWVDIPPESPSAYDDEFDDGSLDAKWTWYNQSYLDTWDEDTTKEDCLYLQHPGWDSTRWAILYQACTEGSFDLRTKVSWGGWRGNYTRIGLFIGEATPGEFTTILIGYDEYPRIRVQHFSDPNTWAEHLADIEFNGNKMYLRIGYDGSTFRFYYSDDGRAWTELYHTSSLGFTMGSIGIGIDKIFYPVGYDDSVAVFDWFRVSV